MQNSETEEKTALIKTIRRAFAGNVRPGSRNIIDGDPYDGFEIEEMYERLKNLKWEKLPLNIERHRHDQLYWLTPDAFGYFLPGYMIACISDPEEVDMLSDRVLWELAPIDVLGQRVDGTGPLGRLINGMTREQHEAVYAYLSFEYRNAVDEIDRQDIESPYKFWKNLVRQS